MKTFTKFIIEKFPDGNVAIRIIKPRNEFSD